MHRRGLLAGMLTSVVFTTNLALFCATSIADGIFRPLTVATMLTMFGVLMAMQAMVGLRAFRGAPLVRPLAALTAGFMTGAFTVLLAGDVVVRIAKPGFMPAGAAGTVVLWIEVLAPMAVLFALSGVTVATAVGAARARLRTS